MNKVQPYETSVLMKFLYTVLINLAMLGLSVIGLALFVLGLGLADQIDVAVNIYLGWGYVRNFLLTPALPI